MKRWTGQYRVGSLPVRLSGSDMSCDLRTQDQIVPVVAQRQSSATRLWVCDPHGLALWRAGLLVAELVDAVEDDPVYGRCTGLNEQGQRCERQGAAYYPALPRCTTHEDQLPTRWDFEADDEISTFTTRFDAMVAAEDRAASRAEQDRRDAAHRWERLRRSGRVVLADARARIADQQGALALD